MPRSVKARRSSTRRAACAAPAADTPPSAEGEADIGLVSPVTCVTEATTRRMRESRSNHPTRRQRDVAPVTRVPSARGDGRDVQGTLRCDRYFEAHVRQPGGPAGVRLAVLARQGAVRPPPAALASPAARGPAAAHGADRRPADRRADPG